jgi:hypothetical protein
MTLKELNKYWFSDQLMTRKIDDDTTMIYNPDNGDMYELNSVSSEIVGLLQEHKTGDDIINILSSEYDVDVDTIVTDTEPLIDRLIEMELLKMEENYD